MWGSCAPWGSGKHPHMRGEDQKTCSLKAKWKETPPHAWGRRVHAFDACGHSETPPHAWGRRLSPASAHLAFRNTPTCVGKTGLTPEAFAVAWKHPHMRGEDTKGVSLCLLPLETPPHAWGRHKEGYPRLRRGGNTPTCVGKTYEGSNITCASMKHPHMRGEDPAERWSRRMK